MATRNGTAALGAIAVAERLRFSRLDSVYSWQISRIFLGENFESRLCSNLMLYRATLYRIRIIIARSRPICCPSHVMVIIEVSMRTNSTVASTRLCCIKQSPCADHLYNHNNVHNVDFD